MNINLTWGSHLPILIKVLNHTTGPILELGTGLYSTPYLHYACLDNKRRVVSYETEKKFYDMYRGFTCDYHDVKLVDKSWENAELEKEWDIVFIDSYPDKDRKELAKRVAKFTKFLILHDTQNIRKARELYKYSEVYKLFKNRYEYKRCYPYTSVLSNIDLSFLE